jgi:hypothetical protein
MADYIRSMRTYSPVWPTETKPRRWKAVTSERAARLQAEIDAMALSGPSALTDQERQEIREKVAGRCRWNMRNL